MAAEPRIVNAFTADGAGGNPAGVVLDADGLSEAEMLAIAKRLDVPETAFVSSSKTATHRVRFFSPTDEVDLCGHATIAAWSLLHQNGLPAGDYTQETMAGVLKVAVQDDGVVFMEQAPATFYEEIPRSELAGVLGLAEGDFHETLPPQNVSTGLKDAMVPVKNEAVLAKIRPDFAAITELSKKYGITCLHVFALCEDGGSLTAARNFCPLYGIPEEAATGTCTGAMLCYLKEHGALPQHEMYRAEQGRAMGQLSYIYGKFVGDVVWIGGRAKAA
ncbi:MAG TPA: PhzF family phenazine biosynthesis protein [Candidatus Saccharimonadales bacterium]